MAHAAPLKRSPEEDELTPNKDHPDGTAPPGTGDGNASTWLAPRPISRPPVDPNSSRAFGRPPGFEGSFLGPEEPPAQGEFIPRNAAPAPVLEEAFGRPVPATESLQRHPAD